ncbi:MAG: sulfite exporter TauE/SafE family protein [Haloarcula sp.]
MSFPVSPEFVVAVTLLVIVAGAVNGVAGFGFAVVGTMALAAVVDPATAVVFMIIPILAVNVSLVGDLSTTQLQTCGRRFGPLLLSALGGTIAGMVLLERIPEGPLRIGLGLVSLGFVITSQQLVRIPGLERTKEGCFVEHPAAMAGVGGLSGLLFGGTNVGVQLVAYVRSCDLSHGLFVGVVALVFLGLNGIRVAIAAGLGLYPDTLLLGGSVAAAIPAVAGVAIGKRLRDRVGGWLRRGAVLALLTVIGVRLVLGGLGVA